MVKFNDNKYFFVAVDFDGTMVHHPGGTSLEHYHKQKFIPVPDALKWCNYFIDLGIKLILWTSRGKQSGLDDAIEYMQKNNINLYGINNNIIQKSWSDSPKVHAHVYIDDNGLVPLFYPIKGKRGVVNWDIVGPMVTDRFYNKEKYYF